MRHLLLLAIAAVSLAMAPDAHATKRLTKTHDIVLRHKEFHPAYNVTVSAGDVLRICNEDPFQHQPFAINKLNSFEAMLRPGECYEYRAHNPTDSAITMKIYDQIHSQERTEITILSMNATFDASALPAPRDVEWVVYIAEDGALCCLHDQWDHYPQKRDGELPYAIMIAELGRVESRSDVRILRRGFDRDEDATRWVCGHDVLEGARWTRNYARVEGVLVGNLPCSANIKRP